MCPVAQVWLSLPFSPHWDQHGSGPEKAARAPLLEKGVSAQPSGSPLCPQMATAQQAVLFLSPVCPKAAACKVKLREEFQFVSPEVKGGKRLVQN